MFIGSGDEGTIYRYSDIALKIYKEKCPKYRLSEADALALRGLTTSRVLLPRELVYDENGVFCGYAISFIKPKKTIGITRMKMTDFVSEIDLLSDDVAMLTDNRVEVNDFYLDNVVFDGGIYLIDPGSYVVNANPDMGLILKKGNKFQLDYLVRDSIFGMLPLTTKEFGRISSIFSGDRDFCELLHMTARKEESVQQYVKRMSSK